MRMHLVLNVNETKEGAESALENTPSDNREMTAILAKP